MMRPTGPAAAVTVGLAIAAANVSPAAADGEPTEPAPPPVAERRIVGDGEHRSGLVVDDGEEVRTVCLRFEEEAITGEDLLERSGLDLELAHFGTLGAAVCAIGDVGCPAGDCHCEASYWSYWQHEPEAGDGWVSSPVGASSRQLRDGDLDARVWGDGRRRPPAIDLDTVCEPDGADITRGPLADDHPDAPSPPEAVDTTDPGEPATDLAWFALAIGLVATAIWWRRRRRRSGGG